MSFYFIKIQLYKYCQLIYVKVADIKNKLHIEIKTGKNKRFYINPTLREQFDNYIASMAFDCFLFSSRKGHNKPLTRVQAYRIIIENYVFSDATLTYITRLATAGTEGVNNLTGTNSVDRIYGFGDKDDYITPSSLNNIINSKAGNDYIATCYSDDTYLFNSGDGGYWVVDAYGNDKIKFGNDVQKENIVFSKDDSAIYIDYSAILYEDWIGIQSSLNICAALIERCF